MQHDKPVHLAEIGRSNGWVAHAPQRLDAILTIDVEVREAYYWNDLRIDLRSWCEPVGSQGSRLVLFRPQAKCYSEHIRTASRCRQRVRVTEAQTMLPEGGEIWQTKRLR